MGRRISLTGALSLQGARGEAKGLTPAQRRKGKYYPLALAFYTKRYLEQIYWTSV
jgi:hypothetical protein